MICKIQTIYHNILNSIHTPTKILALAQHTLNNLNIYVMLITLELSNFVFECLRIKWLVIWRIYLYIFTWTPIYVFKKTSLQIVNITCPGSFWRKIQINISNHQLISSGTEGHFSKMSSHLYICNFKNKILKCGYWLKPFTYSYIQEILFWCFPDGKSVHGWVLLKLHSCIFPLGKTLIL